ncbi:hypothetical protein DM860_016817 [Cuscuta australis]|uniref:FAR1 domain-containing protein n=1 Tax=Cuscuta australis TaxID=267555 RepID=A0A328E0R4_9ASTE|nr:hypothetical protein DM860_016817 [Cuscuta australis]
MTSNEGPTHATEIISTSSNLFIPACPEEAKPKVGMVFQSLEDGFNFYKEYIALAGFDIRKSTNSKVSGVAVWRYVVCNREGHKHFASTCNKPTHDDGDLPKAGTGEPNLFENYCGVRAPSVIKVLPPQPAHNKGSGKRIKSAKELQIEQSRKNKRLCQTCKELGYHDSRNCPMNTLT